ncbi:phosphate-starvation-inducible PsiE family protein [Nitrosococcus wardiae]|uniref:Phosphate-starvation-inducible E-like protein n=1 Tax=Nitrosococcus wardiae TaxID=1814290 RepID=A0A4P7C2R8_9GAMM|nr:phosphate-starvation-inducible PsiE family protein [Nitrosococcus wardiae]QBQ55182.1 phosphate-starvation-inducible E-like protein [Nitrosococcus wardiae]
MRDFLKVFEQIIVLALIVMMAFVLLMTTIDLGWLIVKDLIEPPVLLLDVDQLLDIFGFFLLVLIGIELLGTIKVYFDEKVLHVQVVLEVAMIAIARKIIILDVKELSSLTLIGIASIVIALAIAFYLVKQIFPLHSKSPPKRKD